MGRAINPLLVDEQARGAIVQGFGDALYEHALYDAAGQLLNGTLVDYLVPMAAELPAAGGAVSSSARGASGWMGVRPEGERRQQPRAS